MTTGTNTTLKGSIAFGAIIIGAAIAFASSQDGAGETPETEQGDVAEAINHAPGSQAQRRAEDAEQSEEYGEEELLEWGEEALLDDTSGFDPTPGGPAGGSTDNNFSTDDDIADVYVEVENRPAAPSRLAAPSRPAAPSGSFTPSAPTGRAAPSGPNGPAAQGVRVGIPSSADLPS